MGPHINRDPNEGQESGRTCVRVCVCVYRACTIGAYCEHRITYARIKSFALQRSRKLIPISPEVKVVVNMIREHLLGTSPNLEGGLRRALCAVRFQRTKRERRDTARRERERSGLALLRNQDRKYGRNKIFKISALASYSMSPGSRKPKRKMNVI